MSIYEYGGNPMYRIQINKATLRNHIHYDWWKYVTGILATMFIWSMVTTMTRPQTPPEKKLDIYMVGDYMLLDTAEPIENKILEDFPELLEVNIFNISLQGEMEYMGRQQLMVMLGSQSGDIFVFDEQEFKMIAEQGAFVPLDEYVEELKGFVSEEKLEKYKFKDLEEEEYHYYGVPMEGITLFKETGYDVSDKVMGVMAYSKNQEKAIEAVKWFLEKGVE